MSDTSTNTDQLTDSVGGNGSKGEPVIVERPIRKLLSSPILWVGSAIVLWLGLMIAGFLELDRFEGVSPAPFQAFANLGQGAQLLASLATFVGFVVIALTLLTQRQALKANQDQFERTMDTLTKAVNRFENASNSLSQVADSLHDGANIQAMLASREATLDKLSRSALGEDFDKLQKQVDELNKKLETMIGDLLNKPAKTTNTNAAGPSTSHG